MAAYPNLANYELPQDPCPPYEENDGSSTDDEDYSDAVIEGFMYDDHGELVPVSNNDPSAPVASTASASEPSPPPAAEVPRPANTSSIFASSKKQIKLTKDPSGKFGIKCTRMGPRMFLSYVERNSNAAKCGLGFGDQILEVRGIDISRISGSALMSTLSSASIREVHCTVLMRPYDFNIEGIVDSNLELHYKTLLGKKLGTVKVHRVAKCGYIKNLKLLSVNEEEVYGYKEGQLLSILVQSVGKVIRLRVMPASLYLHLMRKQDKNRVKNLLQLSPRIL